MTEWIDCDYAWDKGDVGYLYESHDLNTGNVRIGLREIPCHTNLSHEPRLYGWCGSWNNDSTTARGCARVVRVSNSRQRMQILRIDGDELVRFLEADGYPELIPSRLRVA